MSNIKKTILLIDWSNLMHRSLCLNALYGITGKGTNYDSQEEVKSFIHKFAIDVCAILNIFKPTKIVIAADAAHPWRKDLNIDEVAYKGNRQRDGVYNWTNIFNGANDLLEYFRKNGANILTCKNGEADDMIALCKETVFESYPDYNIIIVSADQDIRQLIDFNVVTKQYCIAYNTIAKGKSGKRIMYVPNDFITWYNQPESNDIFFSSYDPNKQYIKEILASNSLIDIQEENAMQILINKIFSGDDGDSVPSIYSWYKNGRQYRITEAKTKKICESIGIKNVQNIVDAAKCGKLHPALEDASKRTIEDIDIEKRVQRQRLLVELNSSLFPQHIQDYKKQIPYMLDDVKTLTYPLKAATILEGTKYADSGKKKAIEASIFKDMDKYIGNKLF